MRDDEKKKLHENLKQEIRSLLISSPKTKYGGLTGSLLYFDYKELNCGKEIPYGELGFHSFLALLRSMPDVVRIEYKENSPSYRVHPVYDQSTAHIQKMVLEQRDKYEHQNRLHIQNWHSDNPIPRNFYNSDPLPYFGNCLSYYAYDSVEYNFPVYQKSFQHKSNNSLRRPFPQQLLEPIKRKVESTLEPYLLLTPVTPPDYQKQDEKRNFDEKNLLPCLSPKSNDNSETCSTPNTFLQTPPNCDFHDFCLNDSIKSSNKDLPEKNDTNSSIEHPKQMEDDSQLITSIDVIPNLEINQLCSSPSIPTANGVIKSPTDNRNISPAMIDKKSPSNNELVVNTLDCNVQKQCEINENENLTKRISNAIRQCIDFRYIHRLCEVKFEYRHYPLSNEIVSIRSHYEKLARNQYKQELEDFEKEYQFNSSINDQKCQMMFDQYICLQRRYYYMNKIMNKNHR